MSIQALALSLIAVLSISSTTADARVVQDDPPPTTSEIQAQIGLLRESNAEGTAAQITVLEEALVVLTRAAETRARAEQFLMEAAQAPSLVETVRAELLALPTEFVPPPNPDSELSKVQDAHAQALASLSASRAKLAELDETSRSRAQRRAEIPQELVAADQVESTSREALTSLPAGADQASRMILLASIEDSLASAAALIAERDANEARRELLGLRQDRAVRKESLAVQAETYWKKRLTAVRASEGNQSAQTVETEADKIVATHPELRDLADQIAVLAARRSGEEGLPQRISRAQTSLAGLKSKLKEVRNRSRSARRRIAVGGATESMGLILRWDYDWLPKVRELRSESRELEWRLADALLELITIEESRSKVGDLAIAADLILQELKIQDPSEALRLATRELLSLQRSVHDSLLSDLATLTTAFYTKKEASVLLDEEVRQYRTFIEQRILWVRSTRSNPIPSLTNTPADVRDLAGELWRTISIDSLLRSASKMWLSLSLVSLFLIGILVRRGHFKRHREQMASDVRSFRTDKYSLTVRAILDTILLALPLPLLVWMLGEVFSNLAPDLPRDLSPALPRDLGAALTQTAYIWLVVRFLRELAEEKSVGGSHFRWPEQSLVAFRKELSWFEPIIIVLALVTIFMGLESTTAWSDSVGRIGFVACMVTEAVFAHRLFRAESKLWPPAAAASKGLLRKTHGIWSFMAAGLPITIAVMSLAGYAYTALQFELRLRTSFGFAIVLVLANSMLIRWLLMTRRKLAVRQALEARARKAKEDPDDAAEASAAPVDDDAVDIPAIDAQTRQLFQISLSLTAVIGLYFIWASVFPALRALENVQILPEFAIVAAAADVNEVTRTVEAVAGTQIGSEDVNEEPAASSMGGLSPMTAAGMGALSGESNPVPGGSTQVAPGAESESVAYTLTLADLILAVVFLILTSVAAKNLPALLELSLLQRLPLDRGARYAVSTIVRYLIMIIGATAVSSALGIGWAKVQWLAAALTFGLAFGLQEIFANFVSGLIILIERPIRVGDVVTVGDTEGRVTQLNMRATTIIDRDRKEYLVPNKDFITNNVINWTLSDPITRVILKVGIAYGSDTELARRLLLKAAGQVSLVLKEPHASVVYRAFGDSTLDFELRVFLNNRDLWPEVVDQLNTRIDGLFRQNGVEIAFPQRDLHIRSSVSIPNHVTVFETGEEA